YSTPNKTKANVGDEITVNFSQRDGYTLSSAKFNNTALTISNNAAKFTMPAGNVSITTTYTPIEYTITSDQYSTPSKTKANVGDEITVNFSQRSGYTLSSAKFNNTALTINNNAATFTMPAGNVSITATYTPIEYNITANEFVTTNKTKATINDKVTFSVTDRTNDGYKLNKILVNGAEFSGTEFEMKNYLQDVVISAVYSKIESESKPEIITDGNVEINLPDNIQENSLVYFTVAQKEGYSAFVYVNGLLTDEYSFVFKGKVEIKVDYKEFSVTDITLETEGYCAGDVINMTFTTDNFAKQYEITFSDEGLKEGFKNIDFKDVTAYQKQLEAFKIPENAKPGKYHAFIRVMDSHGSRSKNFVFEFEVFYPNNIIETKYSDLICVNNFNNEFIGYQWLKNNKEVFGENRQFFFDLPFLNGIYSVVLTKNNGDKIRTCNFEVKDIKQKKFVEKSVKVYPNPAKSGEDINLELSGFDNFNGVYILIYNQLGTVISKISNIKNLNTLSLKRGFYTGTVIDKNEKLNFKIIVND
ncbi:MAG: T9SS type A sorting domain-containing protein, partial [Bacteroidales bacterium]|nr:T9SS type A sorting domain-containing protein [Bacteroidales bacterium]